MVFLINQIIIGWVINLLLFYMNFDNGNYIGASAALAALVLAYFHEAYNVGLWSMLGNQDAYKPEDIDGYQAKKNKCQKLLFIGMVVCLVLSFIDYYVNA